MTIKPNTETRTSGIDVSNLGDYETLKVKTPEGKKIKAKLYGR